jgi:hypothetical protein
VVALVCVKKGGRQAFGVNDWRQPVKEVNAEIKASGETRNLRCEGRGGSLR